jgi:hypothetical protein
MAISNSIKWPLKLPHWDLPTKYRYEYNIEGNKIIEIKNVVVYEFHLGDMEDPDMWAAQHLYEWEHSEMGKWVKAHASETPIWHRHVEPGYMGWRYVITAKLTGKDYTYWAIKWQKLNP